MGDELKMVFDEMVKRFKKGKAPRAMSFYFSLGEGQGEKWTLFISKDSCEAKEGKHTDNADCVLKTSKDMFMKMIAGQYTPGVRDFMSGKVKSNDPMLLKTLTEVFG